MFCPVESLQRAAHVCDNVVISIRDSSADAILVFAPDGTESTFATDHSNPRGIAFDPSGDLLVAELKELSAQGDILKFSTNGSQTVFASGIGQPQGNGGLSLDGEALFHDGVYSCYGHSSRRDISVVSADFPVVGRVEAHGSGSPSRMAHHNVVDLGPYSRTLPAPVQRSECAFPLGPPARPVSSVSGSCLPHLVDLRRRHFWIPSAALFPMASPNHLTNRWSQPLTAAMSTFGFMKQSLIFVTLTASSGGLALSR